MRNLLLVLVLAGGLASGPSVGAQNASTWEAAVLQVMLLDHAGAGIIAGYTRIISRPGVNAVKGGTAFHVGGGVFYTSARVASLPAGWPLKYADYTDFAVVSPERARIDSAWNVRSWWPVSRTCLHPSWSRGYSASPFDVAQLKAVGWDVQQFPDLQQFPALRLSPRPAGQGDHVRIAGFPVASQEWPPKRDLASGTVGEVRSLEESFLIRVETGLSGGGSSGSPVLNEDDEVVGMVYGGSWAGHEQEPEALAVTAAAIQTTCR